MYKYATVNVCGKLQAVVRVSNTVERNGSQSFEATCTPPAAAATLTVLEPKLDAVSGD